MARKKAVPTYRKQKTKSGNLAFCEFNGRRFYLGKFNSPESRERYLAVLAEHKVGGGLVHRGELTIAELCAAFLEHASEYYRYDDSSTTSEVTSFERCMVPLCKLYKALKIDGFTPLRLQAVRQEMIDMGWSRKYVNAQISRIRRLVKWGVSQDLVSPSVLHGLQAVVGLKWGRSTAHETEPVKPIHADTVAATIKHLTPTVAAMVKVQQLCGCRPGEVCQLRACDLTMGDKIWVFCPKTFKTKHHGHSRRILLGPKAQSLITPFLGIDTLAYVFSPKRSAAERREALHRARVTPKSCGNIEGSNRKLNPKRAPGDRYYTSTYAKAILRACRTAFPCPDTITDAAERKQWDRDHSWSPGRLRHSTATALRDKYGIDTAGCILGHQIGSEVTAIYAESNLERAAEIVAKIG